VAVYYKSANCDPLTPLLQFVVSIVDKILTDSMTSSSRGVVCIMPGMAFVLLQLSVMVTCGNDFSRLEFSLPERYKMLL